MSRFYQVAWVFYLVLATSAVVWVGWEKGHISLSLFIDPASWWIDLAIGPPIGLALVALWSLGRRHLDTLAQLETEIRRAVGPLDAAEAVGLALISAFAEELFFRGAMQSSWGWGWAVVIFALLHSTPGKYFGVWMVYALAAGLVFAAVTLSRGSIAAAFLAHFTVNAIHLRRIGRLDEPEIAEA